MYTKTSHKMRCLEALGGLLKFALSRTGFSLTLLVISIQLAASLEKASHGSECKSTCDTHEDSKYFWCKTTSSSEYKHSWDYCSPALGVDYKYRKCATACSKDDGKDYYWCRLEGGSWGYCSPRDKSTQETDSFDLTAPGNNLFGYNRKSTHGVPCKSKCEQKDQNNYWCHTVGKIDGDTWDYCSPKDGVDSYNRECHSTCDHHGSLYKWCYISTTSRDWHYCS